MIDEKILIETIKDHAQKVGCGKTVVEAGYQLAHEHIIDIVHIISKQNKRNKKGIFSAPIKTDKVEVVRCKDCEVPHNHFLGCPNMNGLVPPPDHFCSFGKRKD